MSGRRAQQCRELIEWKQLENNYKIEKIKKKVEILAIGEDFDVPFLLLCESDECLWSVARNALSFLNLILSLATAAHSPIIKPTEFSLHGGRQDQFGSRIDEAADSIESVSQSIQNS